MSGSQNPWTWSPEYQGYFRFAVDAYGTLSSPSALFLKAELYPEHRTSADRKVPVKVNDKRYGIKQKGMRSNHTMLGVLSIPIGYSRATMLTSLSSTPRQAPIATAPQYQPPPSYTYAELQSPQSSGFAFPNSSYTYDTSSRLLALFSSFHSLTTV